MHHSNKDVLICWRCISNLALEQVNYMLRFYRCHVKSECALNNTGDSRRFLPNTHFSPCENYWIAIYDSNGFFTLTCGGRKKIENLSSIWSFFLTQVTSIMILANYVLNMSKVNCVWNWTSLPHHMTYLLFCEISGLGALFSHQLL